MFSAIFPLQLQHGFQCIFPLQNNPKIFMLKMDYDWLVFYWGGGGWGVGGDGGWGGGGGGWGTMSYNKII